MSIEGTPSSDALLARLRVLAQAGEILAGSLDYGQTLQHVAELAVPVIADFCVVDVVDEGAMRRVAVAHAVAEKLPLLHQLRDEYPPTLDSPQPAARVLRTGAPHLLESIDDLVVHAHTRSPEHARLMAALNIRSHLAVPLVAHGVRLGAISLGITESDRRYGRDDVAFALDLARLAALAVDNALLYRSVQRELDQRRQTEAALRLSEQRFRAAMDQSPLSMQVFDRHGRTIRVNRAWEQLWGVTLDRITDYNVLHDPQLEVAGIAPLLRRAFAGEVVELPMIRYDPNVTLPDRTDHAQSARWVRALAYPVKDDAHEVCEVVLVHEDVTAVRESESRLSESEERLRLALEAGGMNVWDWDLTTDVVACSGNALAFWGIEIGRSDDFMRVVHPEDREMVAETGRRLIASRATTYEATYRLLDEGGTVRWVESRGRLDYDASGPATRILGISIDITASKLAEQRKDEFLATLAHELRNPLAPIRTASALLRVATDPQAIGRSRAVIERQVNHLVRLVDDLLDVSRITRGMIELSRERVDLVAVVGAAVETSRPHLDAGAITLDVHLPEESIVLDADRVRLSQALGNLLINAAKFTPAGGHVDLSAELLAGDVLIRVRDNGIGLPPAMLARVFDMFAQVKRGHASPAGLGIGLTIVKRLVELHGGTVWAESEGEGCGSTFVIRLPLPAPAGHPASPASAHDADAAEPHPRRVLLVDDNADAAEMLATLLELRGNDVRVAASGAAALDALAGFAPDVALLDIGLPDMSGYDLVQEIRTRATGRVLLVAITGWGQPEDRRRAQAAGFHHHLTKPVDHRELEALMAAWAGDAHPPDESR